MTGLSDSFQRPINYLRISVTDRCNLFCFYCRSEGMPLLPKEEVLSYEEIYTIVLAFSELGIKKVRLTGGEPLLRKNLPYLISKLSQIKNIDDLSLTTNGTLLLSYAKELKKSGLKRINVSLDTLRRDRFVQITREDKLEQVLQGIEEAKKIGLEPIKINMVVMRGINDDEVLDFACLSKEKGWHIRFIELMPFCNTFHFLFVSVAEVKERLKALGELEPCLPTADGGPAKYFRLPNSQGTIGFISPISEHFCFSCNRLRLTADGKLRLCLLNEIEIDLKGPLRRGSSLEEIKGIIKKAISQKPLKHHLEMGKKLKGMTYLGG